MSKIITLSKDQQAAIQATMTQIDELLAMRQGFPQAYREWYQAKLNEIRELLGDDVADEYDKKGPRQVPVNRQHRVHIYRQRLHAQRRFFEDLLEQHDASIS